MQVSVLKRHARFWRREPLVFNFLRKSAGVPGVPGIRRGESAAADTAAGVGEAGHGLNDQSSGGGSGGGGGMFGQ